MTTDQNTWQDYCLNSAGSNPNNFGITAKEVKKQEESLPDNETGADDVMHMVRHAKSSDTRQLTLQKLLHNEHTLRYSIDTHSIIRGRQPPESEWVSE